MGRDTLIDELIGITLPYWDGYYIHESSLGEVKEEMKIVLDRMEKSWYNEEQSKRKDLKKHG